MKIAVLGGSGLIGSKLVDLLRQRGHEVVAASLAQMRVLVPRALKSGLLLFKAGASRGERVSYLVCLARIDAWCVWRNMAARTVREQYA